MNDITWEANGSDDSPYSRLLARNDVTIGGVSFHMEAIEVTPGSDQMAADASFDENYRNLVELSGEEEFQTINIEGRPYVIAITPFSR